MNPPAQAVVLPIDEKSQSQALERTRPAPPVAKDHPATQTHDYIRHGTTTLFAALDVLEGTVLGRCMQRHRHGEFIRFLNAVEAAVPAGKLVHAEAECADGHGDEVDAARDHHRVADILQLRRADVRHQPDREWRADHRAAAVTHDGKAGGKAAPVREPFDEGRDRCDVTKPLADAGNDCREINDPKLVD